MATRELKSLTGLRGVAACFVVVYHYHFSAGTIGPAWLETFIGHGYLAVDVFFVLSGFVMALAYGANFVGGAYQGAYVDFLLRRLGRVYPLYLIVTVVCIPLHATGVIKEPLNSSVVISNLLLVQNWGFSYSLIAPGWSISVELAAYAMFPVLAALTLCSRAAASLTVAAAAIIGVLVISMLDISQLHQSDPKNGPLDNYGATTCFPIVRCITEFSLGMLSFRAANTPHLARFIRANLAGDALAIVAVLLLMVRNADVAFVAVVPALIATLSSGRSLTPRILASRVVHWLGLTSYSIYLVHIPIEAALRDPIHRMLDHLDIPHAFSMTSPALVIVTLLIATLSYYGIEKPGRDGSRRLTGGVRLLPEAGFRL